MKIASDTKLLQNYYEKLDRLSHDEEYCHMIWDERIERNLRNQEAFYGGKQEGLVEGLTRGKELGFTEKTKEIALNLYNNGANISLISKSTGLSINEIKSLVNSQ